jgi:hypothetical protein
VLAAFLRRVSKDRPQAPAAILRDARESALLRMTAVCVVSVLKTMSVHQDKIFARARFREFPRNFRKRAALSLVFEFEED